jgi:tetratricopeptide (TPR) repeat protein
MTRISSLLAALLALNGLTGCATQYARTPGGAAASDYTQSVPVAMDREQWGTGPTCLMVVPTSTRDIADKTLVDAFHKTIFGGISAAGYQTIPMRLIDRAYSNIRTVPNEEQLAKELGCDYLAQPVLSEVTTNYAGFFSEIRASGDLVVRRAGQEKPLLKITHVVTSRDGGLPVGPIGILSSLFSAGENQHALAVERLTEDLARQLVSRLPTYAGADGNAHRYASLLNSYRGDIDQWLSTLPADDHVIALRTLLNSPATTHEERERAFSRIPSEALTESDHRVLIASLLQDGQIQRARTLATDLSARGPDNSLNWSLLAHTHRAAEQWKSADAAMVRAIRLNPTATLYEELGAISYKSGDLDRALAAFTKAVEIDAEAPFANLNLGIAAENKGELLVATDFYVRSIQGALKQRRPAVMRSALDSLRSVEQMANSEKISNTLKNMNLLVQNTRKD